MKKMRILTVSKNLIITNLLKKVLENYKTLKERFYLENNM